jgi:hypothetical protein
MEEISSMICTFLSSTLGMPTFSDDISMEENVGGSGGHPVWSTPCVETTNLNNKTTGKYTFCGWVFRYDNTNSLKTVNNHCAYCDPTVTPNLNKCTDAWAHQQTTASNEWSRQFGIEWKLKPSDLIKKVLKWGWLNSKLSGFYNWIDSWMKAKASVGLGPFGRNKVTTDVKGDGSDPRCPPSGQNCVNTTNADGWSLGVAGKFYIEIPPKGDPPNQNSGLGFWFRFEGSLEFSASVGFYNNHIVQTGDCENKDCTGLGVQLTGTVKFGGKFRLFALVQVGGFWAMTCKIAGSANWCGGVMPQFQWDTHGSLGPLDCKMTGNEFGGE